MIRFLQVSGGCVLLIAGLIVTPLPIPFGLLMILTGLSLLVSAVPQVRHALKRLRRRYQETSQGINQRKHHLPAFLRRLIEDTDPDHS